MIDPVCNWVSRQSPTFDEGTTGPNVSFAVVKRGTINIGDLLVIAIGSSTQSTAATVMWSSSGWTYRSPTWAAGVIGRVAGVFTKIADAGDAAASIGAGTWTFAYTGTSGRVSVDMTCWDKNTIDPTTPVRGASTVYASNSDHSTVSPFMIRSPALTGLTNGSTLVHYEFNNATSTSVTEPVTYPSGYTKLSATFTTTAAASKSLIVSMTKKTSGTTEAIATSAWGTGAGAVSSGAMAHVIEIFGAPDAGWPTFARIGGSTVAAKAFLRHPSSGLLVTPTWMGPARPGFTTTTAVLAKAGVTCAHRIGGDLSPEFTQRGMNMTMMRGHGVIDLSVAISSDGVYFLAHDEGPYRITGGASGPYAGAPTTTWVSLTWATISALSFTQTSGGTTAAVAQPPMRLDTFAARYKNDFVFLIDPKYIWSMGTPARNAFMSTVVSLFGTTNWFWKYYGNNSSVTGAADALGIPTWGYFFVANGDVANGSFPTWAAQWTVISMEANTPAGSNWTTALAQGKPVWGHEADTQAEYANAITNGASGVQCRGSSVITPVSTWT